MLASWRSEPRADTTEATRGPRRFAAVPPVLPAPAKPQVASVESRIAKNLRNCHLQLIETERDGNCLFHSLACWLDGYDHVKLRHVVVDYIAAQPELFEADILASGYGSVSEYCERMTEPGEWGDAIVLQAFTLLTGVNIRLFTDYGFTDLNPQATQHFAIVQHRGHYQPALPI